MNALVIDTSSWSLYFKGRGLPLVEEGLASGAVHLPPVVAAELLSARMPLRRRKELEDLLANLPLCGSDLAHWCRVGALRASLAAKGLAVSTPDAHVAQCALDLGAHILSEDHIFASVAGHTQLRIAPR